ncbi:MAG: SBBP repeat-containing protein [Deltaproteobacteria bacterium]|nr:SBBP repeat-containing protein [Deltaproteobacteria bacterium]
MSEIRKTGVFLLAAALVAWPSCKEEDASDAGADGDVTPDAADADGDGDAADADADADADGDEDAADADGTDGGAADWIHLWGGSGAHRAYGIAVDSAGNTYAAGSSGFGDPLVTAYSVFAVKMAPDGSIAWQRYWQSTMLGAVTFPYALAIDEPANRLYVGGSTHTTPGVGPRAFVLALDLDGNEVWSSTWGGNLDSSADTVYGLAAAPGGGVVAVGNSLGLGGPATYDDAFVARFAADGSVPWSVLVVGTSQEYLAGVAVDPDAGIAYVAGWTYSMADNAADVMLAAVGVESGAFSWLRTWNGGDAPVQEDKAYAVAFDGTDLYVAARSQLNDVLQKWDAAGNILWQRAWSDGVQPGIENLSIGAGGAVYAASLTHSPLLDEDALLYKFESTGDLAWVRSWGRSPDSQFATGVVAAGG